VSGAEASGLTAWKTKSCAGETEPKRSIAVPRGRLPGTMSRGTFFDAGEFTDFKRGAVQSFAAD